MKPVKRYTYEYIWLDGYKPQNLRSKIKITQHVWSPPRGNQFIEATNLPEPPMWSFDGSSTKQATGANSDCILSPRREYSEYDDEAYVLCEVWNTDGTPHESNTRRLIADSEYNEDLWLSFEQEYFLYDPKTIVFNGMFLPLGWSKHKEQGEFYCGVGIGQVAGRELVEAHLEACLDLGINMTGANAEVCIGQWEFQIMDKNALKACDDLIMARYLLFKMAERYGYGVNLHPKPMIGDWNGSGCHVNFSTQEMRDRNVDMIQEAWQLEDVDMAEYGEHNKKRLLGTHETAKYGEFKVGVADRTASVRVPPNDAVYLEDRRPASNCDPYRVANQIIKCIYR